MRRALVLGLIVIGVMMPGLAHAAGRGPCSARWMNVTPRMSAEVRVPKVKRIIQCAFRHYGIAEQIPKALYVADRESSFYPWAWNRSSDCRGLYQHMGRYWSGRVHTYLKRWWFPNHYAELSAFNARANALVTALMVKRGGWGPWGG